MQSYTKKKKKKLSVNQVYTGYNQIFSFLRISFEGVRRKKKLYSLNQSKVAAKILRCY